MSLKINTNIAALNAHRNMLKTDNGLTRSLERLSSGLRINRAADDASGMAIADNLKAQALGLGQAIRNANDGINTVQTADGALEEYINIINTVRTKAIQAASDGQSSDSRLAIQRDVNRLLEEADNIAKTTSFNGINMLDGSYVDKKFHIGAYYNETVSISISSTRTTSVGKFALGTGTQVTGNDLVSGALTINGVNTGVSSAGSDNATAQAASSAWAKAAAINSVQSQTGVTASAETTIVGAADIAGGTISAGDVYINGIDLGAVTFSSQDSTGTLVAAINKISDQTLVTASIVDGGKLKLTGENGENIDLTSDGSTLLTTTEQEKFGFSDGSTSSIVTNGSADTLSADEAGVITLESDSAIAIDGTAETDAGFTASQQISVANSISTVDVTTRVAAELSIKKADHALIQLDTIRADIGSVQNQLEATVRNISVTQQNVTAAESGIRDVDFAAESASFAKFQVLAQSGSFAMAQANASLQNVLRLLQ
jgi:flagellin